jgi:hypothetical protein
MTFRLESIENHEMEWENIDDHVLANTEKFFETGMNAFNKQKYPAALIWFGRCADLIKRNNISRHLCPEVYYQLSYTYHCLGQQREALLYAKLIDYDKILKPSSRTFYKAYVERIELYHQRFG